MNLMCWHFEIDTLPHFRETEAEMRDGRVTLCLPFGVWSDPSLPVNIVVEISLDDATPFCIGFDLDNPRGHVRGITLDDIAVERLAKRQTARWYLDMEENLGRKNNRYYEAFVYNLPRNAKIRYEIRVQTMGQASHRLGPHTLYSALPDFARDDILAISAGNGSIDDAFALYYRQDERFHHLRADLLDIKAVRMNFQLAVGHHWYDLTQRGFNPGQLPTLPLINPFHDTVVISIPKADIGQIDHVWWRGERFDLEKKHQVGQARIMFINDCRHTLHDSFEYPHSGYNPPRTSTRMALRDERSLGSSHPNSAEGEIGCGYMFTLDAYRRHRLPHLWSFNGGFLTLLAQESPKDLDIMKADVAHGLLEPTIAGAGGHFLPYFQEETNRHAIQGGIDMVRNILGHCNTVFFPEGKYYRQTPNVTRALQRADQICFLVVDGSTGFWPYRETVQTNAHADGIYIDDHYLWQDRETGLYLLFITDEVREKLLAASAWERQRGKLEKDLRRKFFYFAANPEIRRHHLMVYGDHASRISGNGWFAETDACCEIDRRLAFESALEWIAAHPWIRAITTANLNPDQECVGTLDMQSAIAPELDPGGVAGRDVYGKEFHLDAWYDNWKVFPSFWMGQTLEEISQGMEYAILDWPPAYHNRLYDLARISYGFSLHRALWNKQSISPIAGLNINERHDVIEPDDGAITTTLQCRNAQVYLNAAVWAEWAKTDATTETFLNSGPLMEPLRFVRYRNLKWRAERFRDRPILETPLHWDRDVAPNSILYNRKVLVVMDENGGRITHLFTMHGGVPCCVSGTFKGYSFLAGDNKYGETRICAGEIVQNTVYTPNHAYIACDVRQSRGSTGKKYDPRSGVAREVECHYPDNFNAYRMTQVSANTVEWSYQRTGPAPAWTLESFRNHLAMDREARLHGHEGVVFHQDPPFSKRISLDDRTLTIRYIDVQPGHVVANEFCADLNGAVQLGQRHRLHWVDDHTVEFVSGEKRTVRLELLDRCVLTAETQEGEDNLRLHRVLTDCIEMEAPEGGAFAYRIIVGED
ncbi:MAG: hypothetical protein H7833_18620 [Magnetococcus sp. DMHC-1]|nr:hypothetical protein [Magnetococcales bacterium]